MSTRSQGRATTGFNSLASGQGVTRNPRSRRRFQRQCSWRRRFDVRAQLPRAGVPSERRRARAKASGGATAIGAVASGRACRARWQVGKEDRSRKQVAGSRARLIGEDRRFQRGTIGITSRWRRRADSRHRGEHGRGRADEAEILREGGQKTSAHGAPGRSSPVSRTPDDGRRATACRLGLAGDPVAVERRRSNRDVGAGVEERAVR